MTTAAVVEQPAEEHSDERPAHLAQCRECDAEKARAILGVSGGPRLEKPRAVPKTIQPFRAPKGIEPVTDEAVRRALRERGPLSPGEFQSVFGLESRYKATLALEDLVARGVVLVNGKTVDRKISLPAKEVP